MRVGMPHMGSIYIPIKAMFTRLGVEFVTPPLISKNTLSLGVKHGPEGLCIPFKLTLGTLLEVAEEGADTLIVPAGYGTCRLGYYARTQEKILQELGYDIEMVQMGVSEQKFIGLLKIVKRLAGNASWVKIIGAFRFGLKKLNAIDNLEKSVQKVRPREMIKGTANRIFSRALKDIDAADDNRTLKNVEKDYLNQLDEVDRNPNANPLIVGITGEFYVVLEPFSNFDIESELGKMGVEVRRTTYISDWTKFSLFLNPLGVDEKDRIHKAALPYLKRDIGGDGWETIGEKVLHSGEYDGMVHLAPFTCLPEIMAQNIMPTTREEMAVLTILCDEQMTKTGVLTRLEAFIDLLERKRRTANSKQKEVAAQGV